MRCTGSGRRFVFLCIAGLLLCSSLEALAAERLIRVRLLELHEPRVISVAADGAPVDVFAGEFADPIFTVEGGAAAAIRVSNKQLYVRLEDREVFAQSLRLEPQGEGLVAVHVTEGKSRTGPHAYSGKLIVEADPDDVGTLELVNVVRLEEYVAGVVAKEYPFDDEQGVKAMATAVRTYTLSALGRHGAGYDHVDHTLSQVYGGVERVTPAVRRAVRETEGEVLTHNGELIQALYFSSSGGHTAGNEDVWGSAPLPYLRAQPDPYDAASPHSTWQSTVSRPDLLALLSERYGFEVTGFFLGDSNAHGRVATIDLRRADGSRHTIRAVDFRMLITRRFGTDALKSNHFTARRSGDRYVFEGRGFGHGVGMSQWGAHAMAEAGRDYREILSHYYSDVQVQTLAQLAAGDVPDADRTPTVRPASTDRDALPPRQAGRTTAEEAAPATREPTVTTSEVAEKQNPNPNEPPRREPPRRIGW